MWHVGRRALRQSTASPERPPAGTCFGRRAAAWGRGGAAGHARRHCRARRHARRPRCLAGSGSPAGGWRLGSLAARESYPGRRRSRRRRCQRRRPRRRACHCHHRRLGARHPTGAVPSAAAGAAAAAAPCRPLQHHRRCLGPAARGTGRRGPCRPCRLARHAHAASQVAQGPPALLRSWAPRCRRRWCLRGEATRGAQTCCTATPIGSHGCSACGCAQAPRRRTLAAAAGRHEGRRRGAERRCAAAWCCSMLARCVCLALTAWGVLGVCLREAAAHTSWGASWGLAIDQPGSDAARGSVQRAPGAATRQLGSGAGRGAPRDGPALCWVVGVQMPVRLEGLEGRCVPTRCQRANARRAPHCLGDRVPPSPLWCASLIAKQRCRRLGSGRPH